MIKIYPERNLLEGSITDLINGIGGVTLEPMTCEINLAINGIWELSLTHHIDDDGKHKNIKDGAILKVDIPVVREINKSQLFVINSVTRDFNTISAIAYPMGMEWRNYKLTMDYSPQSKASLEAQNAQLRFKDTSNLVISTDLTNQTENTEHLEQTNLVEVLNGDTEQSFVNKFGAEIAYNNNEFKLLSKLGATNKNDLLYGKNILGMQTDIDRGDMITRLYPISSDGIYLNKEYVSGKPRYIDSAYISDYARPYCGYFQSEYTLIDTNGEVLSTYNDTLDQKYAVESATSTALGNIVTTIINAYLGKSSDTNFANYYEPAYLLTVWDDIVGSVADEATQGCVNDSWKDIVSSTVKAKFDKSVLPSDMAWHEVKVNNVNTRYYGNDDRSMYLFNQWIFDSQRKIWVWLGSDGYDCSSEGGQWDTFSRFTYGGVNYIGSKNYWAVEISTREISTGRSIKITPYCKSQMVLFDDKWYKCTSNGNRKTGITLLNDCKGSFRGWVSSVKTQATTSERALYINLFDKMESEARDAIIKISMQNVQVQIDVADLTTTEEYKDIKLEKYCLGDDVNLIDKDTNKTVPSRVVELIYDCILDRVTNIVIGQDKRLMIDTINNIARRSVPRLRLVAGNGITINGTLISMEG